MVVLSQLGNLILHLPDVGFKYLPIFSKLMVQPLLLLLLSLLHLKHHPVHVASITLDEITILLLPLSLLILISLKLGNPLSLKYLIRSASSPIISDRWYCMMSLPVILTELYILHLNFNLSFLNVINGIL